MRTVAYCGDYTALTTTHWGAKIYVDTRDLSLAPHIMLEGNWEPWVTNAIGTVLEKRRGATFIDVGANVGWYTLVASKAGAGRIFAFEPQKRMFELLTNTIAVNGLGRQVTESSVACGAASGIVELLSRIADAGGAHITGRFLTSEQEPMTSITSACKVRRLDDMVLASLPSAPIVMKVDVEGYEPEVLAGAEELLKLRPFIFLEHNASERSRTMYLMLLELGYKLRHCQHSGHPGVPLTVEQVFEIDSAETIFCEPGRLE